jgi:palmitoyltransferase
VILPAEVFINCYDLGARENLKLFFNVTTNGQYVFRTPSSHFTAIIDPLLIEILLYSPWWVLLTPLRTKPYTSGHAWIRRPGYENGHGGIRGGEELTDEDDDE